MRRAIAFVLLNERGEILLRRRPQQGLLGGMMEVPSSSWREGAACRPCRGTQASARGHALNVLPGTVKHVFSHFELELTVAVGRIGKARSASKDAG